MAPRARNRQQPPDDDDDTDTFSDTQRNELNELVNAAVSGQLRRKLPSIVTAALQEPMGELRALIEGNGGGAGGARGAGRRGDEEDVDDEDDIEQPTRQRGRGRQAPAAARGRRGAGDRVADREPDPDQQPTQRRGAAGGDPELTRLQRQVAKLEQERAAERESMRATERDGILREHLTSVGVDKNRIRGAIAVLRESMRFDDKAKEWSYIAKRDGLDEDIDPIEGVREWAASDEGKSYLAPPSAGGAGGAGAGGPAPQLRRGAGTRPNSGSTRGTSPTPDARQQRAATVQQAQQSLASAIDSLAGGGIPLG